MANCERVEQQHLPTYQEKLEMKRKKERKNRKKRLKKRMTWRYTSLCFIKNFGYELGKK
jgi:hypothetical protein